MLSLAEGAEDKAVNLALGCQATANAMLRQFCQWKAPVLAGLLEYITVHGFGQCAVVDTECERVKLPATYVHRLYLA